VFRATDGLIERFGAERVLDTPIAEAAIAGIAIGMAAYGSGRSPKSVRRVHVQHARPDGEPRRPPA
jgi:hypothetical protein